MSRIVGRWTIVPCPICGEGYVRRIYDAKRGWCRTCSLACRQELQRKEALDKRLARFWDGISGKENADQCWLWERSTNESGYGIVGFQGRGWLAHRLAYTLAVSPIEDGLYVCHRCDNPPCCNPAHLFPGTVTDNVRDSIAKGRFRRATGEAGGLARLTTENVIAIRARYSTGEKRSAIATDLGVSWTTVNHVITRRTWGHVA